MRIPLPQVGLQGPQSQRATSAGQITPARSYAGDQLEQLGGAIVQAGNALQVVQGRVDRVEAMRGSTAYTEGIREQLTSPDGFLNRQGKSAVEGYKETVEAVKKRRQSIAEKMSPAQRDMFLAATADDESRVLGSIDRHFTGQLKAFESGENEAYAKSQAGVYVSLGGVGEEATLAKLSALRAVKAQSEALGEGEEALKGRLLAQTTAMHAGVVESLLTADKTGEAAGYFQANRDEIEPGKAADFERAIQNQSERDVALRLGLAAAARGIEGRNELVQQARDGQISYRVFDIAEGVAAREESVKIRQEAMAKQQLLEQATVWLDQNRRDAQSDPGTLAGIDEMPSAMREGIMAAGLYSQVENYAQNGRFATTPEGDEMLRTMTPADLQGQDWNTIATTMRPVLDDRDMAGLQKMWADANTTPDGPKPVEPEYLTTNREFGDQLAAIGGIAFAKPDKPTADELERKALFLNQVDLAVAQIAVAEGRKPKREDYINYVLQQRERTALTKEGVERPIITFSRAELADGAAAVYRDPKDGQTTTATFAEVQEPSTKAQVLAALTAQREAAKRAGEVGEVQRLDAIIAEQPPLEMAGELARMRKMAGDANAAERSRREAAARVVQRELGPTGYRWVDGIQGESMFPATMEQRWADFNARTGRTPWRHRLFEANAKQSWMAREAARAANAVRFPDDPRYGFEAWHGITQQPQAKK